ncbi:MAG: putative zinc-binding metallopeptidase [Planctomycetaceae bacterium]|nr:putative zinc-binding metallopeptidase [Planctomycetaceae bacterium]
MLTSHCTCSNWLFFGSSCCVKCTREAGLCPSCEAVRGFDVLTDEQDRLNCGTCGTTVRPCQNRRDSNVCNVYIAAESDDDQESMCRYCRFTRVIPNLGIDGNIDRWKRLETAKRRVMVGLELIGVQFDRVNSRLPLIFEFKSDSPEEGQVVTGHASGVITINTREADSVVREQTRIAFGEPQRTLVGHFRHELGHYFWEVLVPNTAMERFRQFFGDERQPDYTTAQHAYYQNGPKKNWATEFVSAYASMHPWEDFAETFGTYLDLRAVLATAIHFGAYSQASRNFFELLEAYQKVGLMANEWNRDMGLLDLVPEVFVEPVADKLCFVHGLLTDEFEDDVCAEVKPSLDRSPTCPI